MSSLQYIRNLASSDCIETLGKQGANSEREYLSLYFFLFFFVHNKWNWYC